MKRIPKIALTMLAGAALGLTAAAASAQANDPQVEQAIASGAVGEQADGYLGFAKPPSTSLRAKVDAINIKRREGYTKVAQSKNVPIEAFAASIGCKMLSNLKPGEAYSVAKGVWAVKGSAPVNLPQQCG